jgi:hypothetical protein
MYGRRQHGSPATRLCICGRLSAFCGVANHRLFRFLFMRTSCARRPTSMRIRNRTRSSVLSPASTFFVPLDVRLFDSGPRAFDATRPIGDVGPPASHFDRVALSLNQQWPGSYRPLLSALYRRLVVPRLTIVRIGVLPMNIVGLRRRLRLLQQSVRDDRYLSNTLHEPRCAIQFVIG